MKHTYFTYTFIVLVLAYLVYTLLTPVDAATVARYHLSEMQVRLIGMTVTVPVVLIWLTALYGYDRFRSYADKIIKSKEGPAFHTIAMGLMVLVASLPFNGIVSVVLRRIATTYPDTLAATTITRNFIPVIFQVVAFVILMKGADALIATLRPKVTLRHSLIVIFGMLLAASLFSSLLVARPFGGTVEGTYFMPAWVVILTVAVPLLFAWYCGSRAVYLIYLYRKNVKGLLYRQMLISLVAGLGTIVVSSIITQIILSLSEKIVRLNFTPLLIIVYILIALLALGYGLLARGARQLKQIEEV